MDTNWTAQVGALNGADIVTRSRPLQSRFSVSSSCLNAKVGPAAKQSTMEHLYMPHAQREVDLGESGAIGKCCPPSSPCDQYPNDSWIPYQSKVHISFLCIHLNDPMIADISGLLLEQEFSKNVHIPPEVNQLLVLARKSISSITSRTLLHQCRKVRQDSQVKRWNGKLNALTVQCKFRAWAITDLQSQPMSGNTSRMDCTLANFHFYCQQDLL